MSDEWLGRLIFGAIIGAVVGFVVGTYAYPDAMLPILLAGAVVGGWFGFLSTPT